MSEYKIKVILLNLNRGSIINGEYSNLLKHIWSVIKKKLKKKKYIFDITTVENDMRYDYYINKIYEGEYDIAIGEVFITEKRIKKINFTYPIATIIPKIVYSKNINFNTTAYLKNLYEYIKKPIIYLLFLSMITCLIFHFNNKKKNIIKSSFYFFAGFLGQSSGILSDTNMKTRIGVIVAIFSFFCIYLFNIYINAFITAKSVHYFYDTNPLEKSISGSRICVSNGVEKELITVNNGVPIVSPTNTTPLKYYIKNKEKDKLDGLLYDDVFKNKNLLQENNLQISNLKLGSYKIGFPINKRKKKFLSDINNIIHILQDDFTFFRICNLWSDNESVIC